MDEPKDEAQRLRSQADQRDRQADADDYIADKRDMAANLADWLNDGDKLSAEHDQRQAAARDRRQGRPSRGQVFDLTAPTRQPVKLWATKTAPSR